MGEEKKACPILMGATGTYEDCMEEACALWVKLEKRTVTPYGHWEYEGCGLINTVPWRYAKHDSEAEDR